MKTVVALDLDGVLYDLLGAMLAYLDDRWLVSIPRERVTTYSLAGLTRNEIIDRDIINLLRDPHFFWRVRPFPEAQEALRLLHRKGFDLQVFTTRSLRRSSQRGRSMKDASLTTRVILERDFPGLISTCYHTQVGSKATLIKRKHARYAVEDHTPTAVQISKKWIQTYLVTDPERTPYTGEFRPGRYLQPVPNILEAARLITGTRE